MDLTSRRFGRRAAMLRLVLGKRAAEAWVAHDPGTPEGEAAASARSSPTAIVGGGGGPGVVRLDGPIESDDMAAMLGEFGIQAVGPSAFRAALDSAVAGMPDEEKMGGDRKRMIEIRVNSPGGNVWAAQSMIAALTRYRREGYGIVAVVEGLAASAATAITNMADEGGLTMFPLANYLIHRAWSSVSGNAGDMIRAASELEETDRTMAVAYAARAGTDEEEMLALMDEDRLLSAGQAVQLRLVDGVEDVRAAEQDDAGDFSLDPYENPRRGAAPSRMWDELLTADAV